MIRSYLLTAGTITAIIATAMAMTKLAQGHLVVGGLLFIGAGLILMSLVKYWEMRTESDV